MRGVRSITRKKRQAVRDSLPGDVHIESLILGHIQNGVDVDVFVIHGDFDVLDDGVDPVVINAVFVVAFGFDIPVGVLAGADKVYDMIAVRRLDDAGVAGLAGCVEAPVVEIGDHLAGVNILI